MVLVMLCIRVLSEETINGWHCAEIRILQLGRARLPHLAVLPSDYMTSVPICQPCHERFKQIVRLGADSFKLGALANAVGFVDAVCLHCDK